MKAAADLPAVDRLEVVNMLSPLLLSVLVAGALPADLPVAGAVDRLATHAQRDFDARERELGLLGSAPLYGLDRTLPLPAGPPEAMDLALRAPVGAAPLYGLEEPAPLPAETAVRR